MEEAVLELVAKAFLLKKIELMAYRVLHAT
jgi:hypothetical protein